MGVQGRPHKNPEEIQKKSRGDPAGIGVGLILWEWESSWDPGEIPQESRGDPKGIQGRSHQESRGDPTRNWCLIDPLGMGILQESRGDPVGLEAGSLGKRGEIPPESRVGSPGEVFLGDPIRNLIPWARWIPWERGRSHGNPTGKPRGQQEFRSSRSSEAKPAPKTSFFHPQISPFSKFFFWKKIRFLFKFEVWELRHGEFPS